MAAAWHEPRCGCCSPRGLPPLPTAPPPSHAAPSVDSHSHIHQHAPQLSPSAPAPLLSAVLALDEDCWPRVLRYCASHRSAVPGLGIHPWRAHAAAAGWDARLAALLAAHPAAIVGEAGLCRAARNLRDPAGRARAWAAQLDVLARQLALGGTLRRAASLHCVKAHGAMAECLRGARAELPPAVALHSFSGGAAQVRELLAIGRVGGRLYFGFSHTVNVAMGGGEGSRRHAALLEAIRAVPAEALLVESDVDDSGSAADATARAVELVACARAWTCDETARRCAENGRRFLRGVGWGGGAAEGAREVDEEAAERAEMVRLCISIPSSSEVLVRVSLL
ncbi:hypothetical protein AB1Y20_018327 [Prymnesium parvum]|uniref:Uncharacterized protein n=1 Tax=Prymnesium parvum TaxID=97485 RepID=A0AB34JNW7_PRYPA